MRNACARNNEIVSLTSTSDSSSSLSLGTSCPLLLRSMRRCRRWSVFSGRRNAATWRKLILVTGREMDDLKRAFSELHLFDWVVAENGAQIYRPSNQESTVLAEPPPPRFVEALERRGVAPLSVGKAIVATWHPYETTVLEVIRDLGLELQVIFNKDAVMVLPASVNKASGLQAALKELQLSPHEVVGVGDAENDHAFLALCECAVAVD